jgi:hypothetical protein
MFLLGLCAATITIFVRSVFRCAELSGGFRGPLANQEVTFMILEGAMICIAVISLTLYHPGLVFQKAWKSAAWTIRGSSEEKVPETGPVSGDTPEIELVPPVVTAAFAT